MELSLPSPPLSHQIRGERQEVVVDGLKKADRVDQPSSKLDDTHQSYLDGFIKPYHYYLLRVRDDGHLVLIITLLVSNYQDRKPGDKNCKIY